MKIETINVEETIENTRRLLAEDPSISPALKSSIELLLLLVTLLLNRLGINSTNSSKPPSADYTPEPQEEKEGPQRKETRWTKWS